jgi:hypothetical protein
MRIVNESGQEVNYDIAYPGAGDCGTIEVDGYVDLPAYDNQPVVNVSVAPTTGNFVFVIVVPSTGTGEQVEMAFVAE